VDKQRSVFAVGASRSSPVTGGCAAPEAGCGAGPCGNGACGLPN